MCLCTCNNIIVKCHVLKNVEQTFLKEEEFISLPHDIKVLQNQPVPKNSAMVCITTQQMLFSANWNDEKFWS